jgi:prepilin-type N-terminal cleavage/methylation domain-containing protein
MRVMKTKQYLSVVWTDVNWDFEIRNRYPGGCRLDKEILRLVSSRFEPLSLSEDMCRPLAFEPRRPRPGGFTLVELLVVIAIIAILAGILLPVLSGVKTRAKVKTTQLEMRGLAMAIQAYESDYSRNPAGPDAEKAATAGSTDFTFGTTGPTLTAYPTVANPPAVPYNANNSEVVAILLDLDQGVNANHVRNTRKTKFWNAKMVNGNSPGVSTDDYIARDPWGNPYIITVDMNDDNKCLDAFYRTKTASERAPGDNSGFNGLSRPNPGADFELNGPVMIWSFGPDKNWDPAQKANAGLNRDNILSWSN